MKLPKIEQHETPKGKRRVRLNQFGNIVGYVGKVRWIEFGRDAPWNWRQARAWEDGDENWKDA